MSITDEMLIHALKESTYVQTVIPGVLGAQGQDIQEYFVQLRLLVPQPQNVQSSSPLWEEAGRLVLAENETDASPFDIADLFAVTTPLSISASPTPQRQILWGPAGSGKSTFCQYIAWCFATNHFQQWQHSINIVLKLRLKRLLLENYQQYYDDLDPTLTAAKLIYLECLSETQQQDLAKQVGSGQVAFDEGTKRIKEWLEQNNPQVLLILDGLDEIKDQLENKDSREGKVIRLLCRHSQLFITSRPFNLPIWLQNTLHRELENQGFTPRDIYDYVNKYFNATPVQAQSFLANIQNHPELFSLARIPLLLRLLCYLFQHQSTSQSQLSDSTIWNQGYTGIYQHVIAYFLQYDQETHHHQTFKSEPESNIHNTLFQHYSVHLNALYQLAFESFIKGQLAIEPKTLESILKKYPETRIDDLVRLGLLIPIGQHHNALALPYEFLHLTFQEYFSALFLAHELATDAALPPDIIQHLIDHRYDRKWEWVWRFLAGYIHNDQGFACLNEVQRNRAQTGFWQIIWGKPYEYTGLGHLWLLMVCLEETRGRHRFALQWEVSWLQTMTSDHSVSVTSSHSNFYLQKFNTHFARFPYLHDKLTEKWLGRIPKTPAEKLALLQKLGAFNFSANVLRKYFTDDDWKLFLLNDDPNTRFQAAVVLESFKALDKNQQIIEILLNAIANESVARNKYRLVHTLLAWLRPWAVHGLIDNIQREMMDCDLGSEAAQRLQTQVADLLKAHHQKEFVVPIEPMIQSIFETWHQIAKHGTFLKTTHQTQKTQEQSITTTLLHYFVTAIQQEDNTALRRHAWQTLHLFIKKLPEELQKSIAQIADHENNPDVYRIAQTALRLLDHPDIVRDDLQPTLTSLHSDNPSERFLAWQYLLQNGQQAQAMPHLLIDDLNDRALYAGLEHCETKQFDNTIQILLDACQIREDIQKKEALHGLKILLAHCPAECFDTTWALVIATNRESVYNLSNDETRELLEILTIHCPAERFDNTFETCLLRIRLDLKWCIAYRLDFQVLVQLAMRGSAKQRDATFETLLAACYDSRETIRADASSALTTLFRLYPSERFDTTFQTLLDKCRDTRESIREAACKTLGAFVPLCQRYQFDTALQTLLDGCHDTRSSVRTAACNALPALTLQCSAEQLDLIFQTLLRVCLDTREWTRKTACKTLGALVSLCSIQQFDTTIQTLLDGCRDTHGSVRIAACYALSAFIPHCPTQHFDKIFQTLLNTYYDSSYKMYRNFLIEFFGNIDVTSDKHFYVRRAAFNALKDSVPYCPVEQFSLTFQILLNTFADDPRCVNSLVGVLTSLVLSCPPEQFSLTFPILFNACYSESALANLVLKCPPQELDTTCLALLNAVRDTDISNGYKREDFYRALAILAPHCPPERFGDTIKILLVAIRDNPYVDSYSRAFTAFIKHCPSECINDSVQTLLLAIRNHDKRSVVATCCCQALATLAAHCPPECLSDIAQTLFFVAATYLMNVTTRKALTTFAPHCPLEHLSNIVQLLLRTTPLLAAYPSLNIHLLPTLYRLSTDLSTTPPTTLTDYLFCLSLTQTIDALLWGLISENLLRVQIAALCLLAQDTTNVMQKLTLHLQSHRDWDPALAIASFEELALGIPIATQFVGLLHIFQHYQQQQTLNVYDLVQSANLNSATPSDLPRPPQEFRTLSQVLLQQEIAVVVERSERVEQMGHKTKHLRLFPAPQSNTYPCTAANRHRLFYSFAQTMGQSTHCPRDALPRFAVARLTTVTNPKTTPNSMHLLRHSLFESEKETTDFTLTKLPEHNAWRIQLQLEQLTTPDTHLNGLEQALQACPNTCRYLDLSNNKLNDDSIAVITNYFPQLPELQGLVLDNNQITEVSLDLLFNKLKTTRIHKLSLANNRIAASVELFKGHILTCLDQQLDFLDLSMNAILPGYVCCNSHGDRIVLREEDRKSDFFRTHSELKEPGKETLWQEESKFCKDHLTTHPLLYSELPGPMSESILCADPLSLPHRDIGKQLISEYGIVTLIRTGTLQNQHVFLILERLTDYGQREIIRADLCQHNGNVKIFIRYHSPQQLLDKLQPVHDQRELSYRMARADQEQIRALLTTIFRTQDGQQFERYEMLPLGRTSATNCLKWAVDKLAEAGIIAEQEMSIWNPTSFFKKPLSTVVLTRAEGSVQTSEKIAQKGNCCTM